MSSDKIIAVTSSSFSNNSSLKEQLLRNFPRSVFNHNSGRFSKQGLENFINKAEGIIVSLDIIDEQVLRSCPKLKVIAKYGVGLENID